LRNKTPACINPNERKRLLTQLDNRIKRKLYFEEVLGMRVPRNPNRKKNISKKPKIK